VPEFLKLAQLVDQYGMTKMQVWCRWIKPGLDAQGLATLQFLYQTLFQENLVGATLDDLHGFCD